MIACRKLWKLIEISETTLAGFQEWGHGPKTNSQEYQVSDMVIVSAFDFTVRKKLLFQC